MTIENTPAAVPAAGTPVTSSSAAPAATKPAARSTAIKAAPKKPAAKAAPKTAPKAKIKPAPEGKYKVLTGIDDETFCARVSDHLDKGWALYGNVAATFNGKNVILAQALLRTKKVKRKK